MRHVIRTAALLLIATTISSSVASGQALTDADVERAIATSNKFKLLDLSEFTISGSTGFRVLVYSPFAWIQQLAADAKKEMRPFSVADVTEDMRADIWRVKAFPSTPRNINDTYGASSVSHVVIRNDNKSIVVQPIEKVPFDASVGNAFGAKLAYAGLLASFPGDGVRDLWGPRRDQEFIVSVIGDTHEYDFTIKQKHFKQLQ